MRYYFERYRDLITGRFICKSKVKNPYTQLVKCYRFKKN